MQFFFWNIDEKGCSLLTFFVAVRGKTICHTYLMHEILRYWYDRCHKEAMKIVRLNHEKSVGYGVVNHGCDHGDFLGMILYYPVGGS